MPSRKRSPTKKNGTCKHCGHRMKGGMFGFFGPTDPDKPSMFSGWFAKKPDVPAPVVPPPAPVVPVPAPDVTSDATGNEIRKAQPVEPKQAGRGGSEPKPLFGTWGGKSKKSKNSKNSKSKKSKKSKK